MSGSGWGSRQRMHWKELKRELERGVGEGLTLTLTLTLTLIGALKRRWRRGNRKLPLSMDL